MSNVWDGYPPNAGEDGMHYLWLRGKLIVAEWDAEECQWIHGSGVYSPVYMVTVGEYVAPCEDDPVSPVWGFVFAGMFLVAAVAAAVTVALVVAR